jgi:hypothetical protein
VSRSGHWPYRTVLEQRRGWPPPEEGETVLGRDSQAHRSSGAALLCQGIKCPYAHVGAGARECVGDARRVPLSGTDPTKGDAQPSSEADFVREAG